MNVNGSDNMDVIFSKALNSTFGNGKFRGFNELLGDQFKKIENAIEENTTKEINAKNTPAYLISDDDFVYDVFDVTSGTSGKTMKMPCDGNISVVVYYKYTYTTENAKYSVEVYKNGQLVTGQVQFKKGDVLNFVGKIRTANDGLWHDGETFAVAIKARESLAGIKFV